MGRCFSGARFPPPLTPPHHSQVPAGEGNAAYETVPRAGAQHGHPPPAQLLQHRRFRLGIIRVAAERVVKTPRDQQALFAAGRRRRTSRAAAPCTSDIAGRNRSAAPGGRNTAARAAPSIWLVVSMKRSAASIQPCSGTQPGRRNMSHGVRVLIAACFQPRAQRSRPTRTKRQPAISATSSVASLRVGVDDDDLAHQPAHRARHQRSQSRHQKALRFVGGDDDAQHGTTGLCTGLPPYHVGVRMRPTRSARKSLICRI